MIIVPLGERAELAAFSMRETRGFLIGANWILAQLLHKIGAGAVLLHGMHVLSSATKSPEIWTLSGVLAGEQ